MIYFKQDSFSEEYKKLDLRVRKITEVLGSLMNALYGAETMITSVYREDIHSPHHYYRAVDVRARDIKDEGCVYLVALMNLIFPYKKGAHDTVIYHDVDQGWHFHIQVKP